MSLFKIRDTRAVYSSIVTYNSYTLISFQENTYSLSEQLPMRKFY
ncbi:unnamed protein product [Acanthoscelides obtectus]|uniref:Uncharacterized protein n=1 Tax=Acanthoscelides obtectus TaxID=200917 RepID=A0A9P0KBK6_ACAOB|nr:unnamed protein product [Acanthoscelides obtectus]CAK1662301.1 hypothetical protein AOBTE_LOCUS23075 [Acanthoscelides obtectus]